MTDGAFFHGIDYLVSNPENSAVSKACGQGSAAIDSCKLLILLISAKLQCTLDHRSEILFPVNMHGSRESYSSGGKDAVHVAWFRRHQAVGCEKDRRRKICKFLLLILPCSTEVSF